MRVLLVVLPVICALLVCGCTEAREEPPAKAPAESPEAQQPPEGGEKAPEPAEAEEKKAPAGEPGETEEKTGKTPGVEESADVEVGVLETKLGKMVIQFYPELAPKTVARIKELIRQGFYDGLIFHRVVPDFCVQGGDPTGTGSGGTGVKIPGEFTNTPFEDGSLGMARANDPDSNDCQFFITLSRKPHLDNNYTLFGKVIEGLDIAHKIEKLPLNGQRPAEDIQIVSFRLEERKLKK